MFNQQCNLQGGSDIMVNQLFCYVGFLKYWLDMVNQQYLDLPNTEITNNFQKKSKNPIYKK